MEPGPSRREGASPRAVVARVAVSALVLGIVLRSLDLTALATILRQASLAQAAMGAVMLAASVALAGLIWYAVMPSGRRFVTVGVALRTTIVGASLNAVLPTTGLAGDVLRGYVSLRAGATPLEAAASVVLARWSSLTALWLAALLVCLGVPREDPRVLQVAVGAAVFLSAVVGGVSLALWAPSRVPVRRVVEHRVMGVSLSALSDAFRGILGDPARLAASLGVALLALVLEGMSLYFVARSVGVGAGALLFVLLTPSVRLVHQVPGFFNAIGLQEVALVAGGGAIGVSPDVSVAISLITHAVRIGVALLGLLLYVSGDAAGVSEEVGGNAS